MPFTVQCGTDGCAQLGKLDTGITNKRIHGITTMTSRRRFIQIAPLAGAALLAACSRTPEPAAPMAPPPTPAPVAAPAAAPTSEPVAGATAAPATGSTAALPRVDEKDAQAVALGYVDDATRADKAKYKAYVAGSQCSGCALFQGKAGDAAGPCPLYAGKSVSAKGWCSAWNKKA